MRCYIVICAVLEIYIYIYIYILFQYILTLPKPAILSPAQLKLCQDLSSSVELCQALSSSIMALRPDVISAAQSSEYAVVTAVTRDSLMYEWYEMGLLQTVSIFY